jgi:hypothetical protein
VADDMIYTVLVTKEQLYEMKVKWEGQRVLVNDEERHVYRWEGEEWIDEGPVTNDSE